jgi:RNA polymerase sigma factor FliA
MYSNLAAAQTTESSVITRNELVLKHLSLIQTIAKRLSKRLPPSVEVEELVNIGVLGLLDAWDRFDATKGVPFKSYAELRIKGQMIDALRSDDLVPRSVRRKNTRLQQERTQLTHRFGRMPTRNEMCSQLDLAPTAYDAYVTDSRIARLTSLDAPVGDDGGATYGDNICLDDSTAEDTFSDKQVREQVASAVHNLPERERKVVTMYYIRRLTLREIGSQLGVTESRACQLRGQGVKRLKFRLRSLHG